MCTNSAGLYLDQFSVHRLENDSARTCLTILGFSSPKAWMYETNSVIFLAFIRPEYALSKPIVVELETDISDKTTKRKEALTKNSSSVV